MAANNVTIHDVQIQTKLSVVENRTERTVNRNTNVMAEEKEELVGDTGAELIDDNCEFIDVGAGSDYSFEDQFRGNNSGKENLSTEEVSEWVKKNEKWIIAAAQNSV